MSATETGKLGKYEITGTLGRGAMGIVYDGRDPIIERRVAIKTVPLAAAGDTEAAEGLARFRREAQAAGRLQHPNIVGVYDYGETDTLAFIVLEFVDGTSLKAELDKGERLPPARAVALMQELLAGLKYSHERGVVHRDIKPANIMLTREGTVKIADFGIARIESSSMTQAGTVMGTPAYMSPEQFMGQTVDARTDIYSAGVVLYQLLAGERPFDGGITAIMHKALHTVPPPPSDLSVTSPPALDAVVARAMGKRPEDRYATAADFSRALDTAMAVPATTPVARAHDADSEATVVGRPPPARPAEPARSAPPPVAPPTPPKRGRGGLLAAIAAVVIVAGGAGAYFALSPQNSPAPAQPPGHPTSDLDKAARDKAAADKAAADKTAAEKAAADQAAADKAAADKAAADKAAADRAAADRAAADQAAADKAAADQAAADKAAADKAATDKAATDKAAAKKAAADKAAAEKAAAEKAAAEKAAAEKAVQERAEREKAAKEQAERQRADRQNAITAALAPVGCKAVFGTVDDKGIAILKGVASSETVSTLRKAANAVSPPITLRDDVATVDGKTYCQVLDALAPALPHFGTAQPELGLSLKGDVKKLAQDDWLVPVVKTPDYPTLLSLFYFQSDKTVTPLQIEDAGQFIAPQTQVSLGDPKPAPDVRNIKPAPNCGDCWQVDKPFGTDLLVAVASAKPLLNAPLGDNASRADVVKAIRDALAAPGQQATAWVLPVQTFAKKK